MNWQEGLSEEKIPVVSHLGAHARVLAGPGTGKTLTLSHRTQFLVEEIGIEPQDILVLTFTRAATATLRERIEERLAAWEGEIPRVSTLHSFALRQIVRNHDLVVVLPQPLRIADDWEERSIIEDDLKRVLGYRVRDVRKRFQRLSADWETLNAESEDWDQVFPDPRFLGAWRQHRRTYGYTLRSELVYQLKRALEQIDDFALEAEYAHVLVDEYQDLNRCDLAVVRRIIQDGGELFAAGDDDQSIYGFRYAHPEGIRRFRSEYTPSTDLPLEICHRCDRRILDVGLYVANLDPQRISKPLGPKEDAADGEVNLLRFHHEVHEAKGVVGICNHLLGAIGYDPEGVLILLRSDRFGVFSSLLERHCRDADIPIGVSVEEIPPLDTREGRAFLSMLRLSVDSRDDLAYRTILSLRENGLGEVTFRTLNDLSNTNSMRFCDAIEDVIRNPESELRYRRRLAQEHKEIEEVIGRFRKTLPVWDSKDGEQELVGGIQELANDFINDGEQRNAVIGYLVSITDVLDVSTVAELLAGLTATVGNVEQELLEDKINILTMHRAKGLTADAVIIVAAEDELIPGPNVGEAEGDERRLFYVSLTRARHHLFITYSTRRYGAQRFSGRERGRYRHTLTRFLQDAPLRPMEGRDYVESIRRTTESS